MQLTVNEIKKIIPHRFPFLLIDRVVELIPNEKIIAIKNVSANEHFFEGHFPSQKIMPGVLILEAMAQAACVYFYYSQNLQGNRFHFYLGKTTARFFAPVVPGDQLQLKVETVKFVGKTGFLKAKAVVGDKEVAEAEIALSAKEI
ncbi:MAG: 3-hydroxyacyl-ACP dehydratase FabZ [Candidatus Omnitrophica bacterium]|nr:3-hydroxyacyl-ACP dehydratase FabZ [Candidatus Omnitrophota bacterium]